MKTIKTNDYQLTYDDSQEAKERVFKMMLDWFQKNRMFTGESLCQSDTTYEEAPNLLAEVAEAGFEFQQQWNDDL